MTEPAPPLDDASLVRAAPVLARLAASAWWRASGWTLEHSLNATVRILRGAARGDSPSDLLQAAEDELRQYLRRLLGVEEGADGDGAEPTATATAAAGDDAIDVDAVVANGHYTTEELRVLGAELLRRSADMDFDDRGHPAYVLILQQLAPDEGRILRLLALEGPQPAVDVRTGGPLGVVKSDLVAPGLSMIGQQAGCRHVDRVHSYLNNLYRLGLIWFSREQLEDLQRYQVLEAQPEVVEAMREAGRGKTVRRSIHLTPFGDDFCRACLPLDSVEIDALPGPARD